MPRRLGQIAQLPSVADVDGDGTVDLNAAFAANGNIWVEAVSGKAGKSLWKAPFEREWFQNAEHSHWAPKMAQLDGRSVVICVAGTRLVGLDLETGKSLWPAVDLGLETIVRPRLADLDHDGQPDLLLVGLEPKDTLSVVAVSLKSRTPIWKKPLQSDVSPHLWSSDWHNARSLPALETWPWIVELDGSHTPEVIVPVIPVMNSDRNQRRGGIEALDGVTGKPRWQHRLKIQNDVLCCDRLLVGPDIDRDGSCDLFVASTLLPIPDCRFRRCAFRRRWPQPLAARPHPGPACKLTDKQKQSLVMQLKRGPRAAGYRSEL